MSLRYIVVEGTIGSGKTDLSKRLAQYFGANLMNEAPHKNPFLIPFYLNASQHALAAQLHFLMERAESIKYILEEEARSEKIITDFLLEKDQIFAPIILNKDEENLYWRIRKKIMPEFIVPDLVIYLQCSEEKVIQNIQAKNSSTFDLFPKGYLHEVHNEYSRFFHLYENAPMLIVNANEFDFKHDDHFELLLHTLSNMKGNRMYLNLSED